VKVIPCQGSIVKAVTANALVALRITANATRYNHLLLCVHGLLLCAVKCQSDASCSVVLNFICLNFCSFSCNYGMKCQLQKACI